MNVCFSDVSYTNIWLLDENPLQTLPNLEKLIVKHSNLADPWNWPRILSLPKIRQVIGVTWARSCDQCNLSKVDDYNTTQEPSRDHTNASKMDNCSSSTQGRKNISPKVKMSYTYTEDTYAHDANEICLLGLPDHMLKWYTHYISPSYYLKSGYKLQCTCICDSRNCTTKPPLESMGTFFQLLQRLFYCLYPLGSIALILNLTVIIVILTSKTLRKSPTMVLIFNMAVCDLLLSVYCMLIATFNAFTKSDTHDAPVNHFVRFLLKEKTPEFKAICHPSIFIFTVAQIVSVTTSMLLTVEKYLVIVYSMKPDVRMTRKISLICLCVAWCVVIAYSVDAVFFLSASEEKINNDEYNYYYCAASGHHVTVTLKIDGQDLKEPMPFSVIFGSVFAFFFLCTIPLYIHIYIVVKKSSTQMGVKREGVLARKLAVLVFTNLIFSAIPLSLTPAASSQDLLTLDFFKPLLRTYSSFQAYMISMVWLPILLMCLNSCVNPLLFAFRHSRFKTQFHQNVVKSLKCLRRKEDQNAGQHHSRRCQNNEEQMVTAF